MLGKGRGNGGEEDRECDGRTALREICKEWEENRKQQQNINGKRSERKVMNEKTTKKTMVTMANLTPALREN